MKNIRNNKGFTLIELMIVVVIIGILAAIAIPKFGSVSTSAKEAEAGPILKQICTLGATYEQRESAKAAKIEDLELVGWDVTTTGKYYTSFTFDGTTAKAVTTTKGLKKKLLNCGTDEGVKDDGAAIA